MFSSLRNTLSCSVPPLNTWAAQLLYGCVLSHVYQAHTACKEVAFWSMVVACLAGDPRSAAARILPAGSVAARLFYSGHKSVFAEPLFCCHSYEGRDMDGWSWELAGRCLIRNTLCLRWENMQSKWEEMHLNLHNRF